MEVSIIENFLSILLNDIILNNEFIESYSECLCKLLNTIGYCLEEENSKDTFHKKYMEPIQKFSKNKKMFSPRIRFMFMDCMERKKWIH